MMDERIEGFDYDVTGGPDVPPLVAWFVILAEISGLTLWVRWMVQP